MTNREKARLMDLLGKYSEEVEDGELRDAIGRLRDLLAEDVWA